jgi:hypothetical protein
MQGTHVIVMATKVMFLLSFYCGHASPGVRLHTSLALHAWGSGDGWGLFPFDSFHSSACQGPSRRGCWLELNKIPLS